MSGTVYCKKIKTFCLKAYSAYSFKKRRFLLFWGVHTSHAWKVQFVWVREGGCRVWGFRGVGFFFLLQRFRFLGFEEMSSARLNVWTFVDSAAAWRSSSNYYESSVAWCSSSGY